MTTNEMERLIMVYGPLRVAVSKLLLMEYKSGRPYVVCGYRTPDEQERLYRKGITRARAWESAHNYGLAVDMAWISNKTGKISYNTPGFWPWLHEQAKPLGLVSLAGDATHLQLEQAWRYVRARKWICRQVIASQGLSGFYRWLEERVR